MKITWFGHACFKLVSDSGVVVITDPFDETVGYRLPNEQADVVTVSHQHFDHNYVQGIRGNPEVVDKIGNFYIKDISIKGVKSYHDDQGGSKRGINIIYVLYIDGIKVCHLGDLGHALSNDQVEQIGKVDVLLIPVGGTYTIGASTAANVVSSLKPSIVIPMHYKTDKVHFPIDGVDKFLEVMGGGNYLNSHTLEVKKEDVDSKETRVLVLEYKSH
ncbi:L-ascorbate metabolism protein UlaG (beta-lactamase superfamily) [Caldicoprobacter guelmensis]|uniref:MBL fold metallo-hydrolase n=1 Tax=Caldicoprobacter guelmensis TaxID=1170224 RepID=UPI0019588231|nr:MBL fold metallo-hydrolase [Caldicoprobacter guelmensis]MBM7582417.1 L-ascorbate metabolism protein UlaG (beta-lactamase superfamily) [Caldicoprobacter guelmensis]